MKMNVPEALRGQYAVANCEKGCTVLFPDDTDDNKRLALAQLGDVVWMLDGISAKAATDVLTLLQSNATIEEGPMCLSAVLEFLGNCVDQIE